MWWLNNLETPCGGKIIATHADRSCLYKSLSWFDSSSFHQFLNTMFLFSEEFASAHSALADVQACARIFFEGRKRNLWV